MDVNRRRDYTERLSFKIYDQIQSKYYVSNRSLSKESISFDKSKCQKNDETLNGDGILSNILLFSF